MRASEIRTCRFDWPMPTVKPTRARLHSGSSAKAVESIPPLLVQLSLVRFLQLLRHSSPAFCVRQPEECAWPSGTMSRTPASRSFFGMPIMPHSGLWQPGGEGSAALAAMCCARKKTAEQQHQQTTDSSNNRKTPEQPQQKNNGSNKNKNTTWLHAHAGAADRAAVLQDQNRVLGDCDRQRTVCVQWRNVAPARQNAAE